MQSLEAFVDWKKCPLEKVPVVIQRDFGIIEGVAWLGKEEFSMLLQLELALARAQKREPKFLIDCDRDAVAYRSTNTETDDFWKKLPSMEWALFLQNPHDARMLVSPQTLWEKTYDGLLPAIVQDKASSEVLMLAWVNRAAWADSMLTGSTCFYSRSKGRLWRKGEESGNRQIIQECQILAGRDIPHTIVFVAEQVGGAACHDGYRSCFYRRIDASELTVVGERVFDPSVVYKKKGE